jgi:enoyl-CoA hydratase/carnithine racemase
VASTTGPELLVARDGVVTTITLNRPSALNAFDSVMAAGVADAIERAAVDPSCRVIVLTGAGRGFCGGADLRVLERILVARDTDAARELVTNGARIVKSIIAAPKPVIAAVNGAAAGGGASIALACDMRVASDQASIGAVFNRIGLHPDLGATYLLPLIVGLGRAMELVLSGDMIPAMEAHRIGLFNRVVGGDVLMYETKALAQRLAAKAPAALMRAKRSMYASAGGSLDQALALELEQQLALFEMKETADALRAYLEKR